MANPYPMQGQQMMQPPMQPPMGTGQGAQMRPPKQGTSRAVPVVVSAGLAIGVFCGLLFGLGIEKEAEAVTTTAETTTTTTSPKKPDGDVAAPFQPERKNVNVPSLAPQVVKTDGSATPATGSGSGSDTKTVAGTGSGSAETPAAPAKPTKVNGTLKIDIQPEGALKIAKVSIDGKEIDGISYELDLTEMYKDATKDLKDPAAKKPEVKKEVKVVVKASGFKDFTSKVDVIAERDTTLKVEMQKRSSGNIGGLPRPPPPGGNTRPPPSGGPKCKKPPCGLIDI